MKILITIITIIAVLVVIYLLYRKIKGPKKLSQDEIAEQWTSLIEGANGEGEKVLKGVIRNMELLEPPDVFVGRKEIKPGPGFIKKRREFLVVEHKVLDAYDMYIGARDYGKQLFVSWYLVPEGLSFWRRLKRNPIKTLLLLPFIVLGWILIFTHIGRDDRKIFNTLNLFDTEELTAYVTTVHHAVLESVKELMENRNIDFSKVDTRTRGFLNLS